METLEFYTSKKKSFWLLVGAALFVAAGCWMFFNADIIQSSRGRSPAFLRVIGMAAVLFFGYGVVIAIKRIIRPERALVLSAEGLEWQVNGSGPGLIPWSEVERFEVIKIYSNKFIVIHLTDPARWMEKEPRFWKRKILAANKATYSSPYTLAAASLATSSDCLLATLNAYLAYFKNSPENRVTGTPDGNIADPENL